MMKKVLLFLICTILPTFSVQNIYAYDLLTGIQRLACEALLCLAATATQPAECAPSLDKYFSIVKTDPRDTFKARRDFLSLCPTGGGQSELINALARGAGNCDMGELIPKLNNHVVRGMIGTEEGSVLRNRDYLPNVPSYCRTYQTVLNSRYNQAVKMPERQKYCYTVPDDETTARRCNSFWTDPDNTASACYAIIRASAHTATNIIDASGTRVCL
jgi:hypothetical protein